MISLYPYRRHLLLQKLQGRAMSLSRAADHVFQARCVALVLANKFGVSADKIQLYSMPARYAECDSEMIKKDLSEIHSAVKSIVSRMNEVLIERPKEQSKSRSDNESR